MKKPTSAAMRAAKAICNIAWTVKADEASQIRVAQIIDNETGLAALLAACETELEYRDKIGGGTHRELANLAKFRTAVGNVYTKPVA